MKTYEGPLFDVIAEDGDTRKYYIVAAKNMGEAMNKVPGTVIQTTKMSPKTILIYEED